MDERIRHAFNVSQSPQEDYLISIYRLSRGSLSLYPQIEDGETFAGGENKGTCYRYDAIRPRPSLIEGEEQWNTFIPGEEVASEN